MFSADVGAVEEQRVGAGLAFDGVAAVAGVPDERVVAGAHQGDVVAASAVDQVVARTSDQDVGTISAIERQRDHIRLQTARVDSVVAPRAR